MVIKDIPKTNRHWNQGYTQNNIWLSKIKRIDIGRILNQGYIRLTCQVVIECFHINRNPQIAKRVAWQLVVRFVERFINTHEEHTVAIMLNPNGFTMSAIRRARQNLSGWVGRCTQHTFAGSHSCVSSHVLRWKETFFLERASIWKGDIHF